MGEPRSFLIVANPFARRGADDIIDLIRYVAPPNAVFQIFYTQPTRLQAGELAERARGCEAVVAVGGDGTVAEAATGLDGDPVALGIVPAGSTNIVARNLGLPTGTEAAAELIFRRPRTRSIDVGLCNGRRFLHMGGAGFDSRIFATTSKRLKRHLGWVAYLQGASQTIFDAPVRFTVTVDGTSMDCESPLVLVANGGSIIHPSISVAPGIRYDDGYLDVIVFTATRPVEIASTLGRLATGTIEKSPFTIHLRGQSIDLATDPPIPVQLDGDIIGDTPAHFSLSPSALEIIVPI
jgi:diacylglycerol kinase (ATP)